MYLRNAALTAVRRRCGDVGVGLGVERPRATDVELLHERCGHVGVLRAAEQAALQHDGLALLDFGIGESFARSRA
jgi:hypothetical protein